MTNPAIYRRNYWATLALGILMVTALVILSVSFFVAIRNSQLSAREDFLEKQTELVSRQLEMEIDRFEIDAKVLRDFVDDEDMDPDDFRQELTETVRRVFNAYPNLIDSTWIDFQDSLISFRMNERNNFIRREITTTSPAQTKHQMRVDGASGIDILFYLNLPSFTQNFVTDYYLDPNGAKYLILEEELVSLSDGLSPRPISLEEDDFARIVEDVFTGIKGFYKLTWYDSETSGEALAAQYPFDFGEIQRDAALVFLQKTDDLDSGIYSTYFLVFGVIVLILAGTILIFTFSLYNNEKSRKELEVKSEEISDLFQQQSLLLQELRGFVFFHDSKGKITRVTQEMEKIIGRNLEQFDRAFQKDSRSEDVKRLREYISRAVEKKLPYVDFEYDYVRRDGKKIRLRIFEKLLYDENGTFLGGNGICTDITKQYESRKELIRSENRLRAVIDNIPDVITIYDNQAKILSLNVKDQSKFLPDSERMIGKSLGEVLSKKQRDKIVNAFELARKTGRIQTEEWRLKTHNTKKFFEIRFFPLDNSQMMSLSREITAQKVWEKGLIEAMNAAEKANQAKSEFLANMSHEIRTPLNGLLGIIDLLEQTGLDETQMNYLQIIKSSGNSLLGIIKDILDYSKIEAGKIDLKEEIFNPGAEVDSLLGIFMGLTQKKNIRLSTEMDEEVNAWYEGDKDKWNQILLNLIGNAIKFTPENGKVLIRLYTEVLTDSAYFLHCEVQDSGIGIPEDQIPYLTDPFYQVESASNRSYQGTGLGLAIAKKIIQIMGGELEIKSKLGEGSTFSFSVLLNKADDQLRFHELQEVAEAFKESESGKDYPLRILLAEDNELNLDLMELMLGQMRYGFDVARNGLEVLEALEHKEYDLILMDVQMPLLNGLETTKRIRSGRFQQDIMIIGLSANVFDEDFTKAIEIGMDDYLTKPIRLRSLAKKLQQAYQKIKLGQAR
ncbi:ATP-binding protein [Algoriphagus namhaensis]